MRGFAALHSASTADGALPTKTKELIALAIGISVHCDGCIAYHVHDALHAGATRAEVIETIGVAVMMGGGMPPARSTARLVSFGPTGTCAGRAAVGRVACGLRSPQTQRARQAAKEAI